MAIAEVAKMPSHINFQQVTLFDFVEKCLLRPQQFIIGLEARGRSVFATLIGWSAGEPAITFCNPIFQGRL
jgi:hypothetical protein